jgi:hypothetical protein
MEGKLSIFVYSDGVENSEDLPMLNSKQLNETAINSTLDRLGIDGLLPVNLNGVPISFPLPGYHLNGSQVAQLKVKRFWRAWAKRTGAKLTWG